MAPQILVNSGPAGLTASVNTVRGAVSITWRRSTISENAATVTMSVAIPVGATAEIRVPALGLDAKTLEIFETGTPVWNGGGGGYKPGAAGINGAAATADGVIFSVTSGNYQFATKAASPAGAVPRIGKVTQRLNLVLPFFCPRLSSLSISFRPVVPVVRLFSVSLSAAAGNLTVSGCKPWTAYKQCDSAWGRYAV